MVADWLLILLGSIPTFTDCWFDVLFIAGGKTLETELPDDAALRGDASFELYVAVMNASTKAIATTAATIE